MNTKLDIHINTQGMKTNYDSYKAIKSITKFIKNP